MDRNKATFLVIAAGLAAACSSGREPKSTRLDPLVLAASDSPSWTAGAPGDPAVAFVGGIQIPASRLSRALAKAPAGTDPEDVLREIIEEEVLAQAAVREAGGQMTVPDSLVERELAFRLLSDRYVEKLGPWDIKRADLDAFFALPPVYYRFNHLTLFYVYDHQLICCNGRPQDCKTESTTACFRQGREEIQAVRKALVSRSPDAEDVPFLKAELAASHPMLGFQEYAFAVDLKTGKQKGTSLFDDAVVAEVISIREREFSQPVRSAFGWHVLYVWKVEPEQQNVQATDPAVDAELRKVLHPHIQEREWVGFISRQIPVKKFKMFERFFKDVEAEGLPEWDVELFPEELEIAPETDKAPEGI